MYVRRYFQKAASKSYYSKTASDHATECRPDLSLWRGLALRQAQRPEGRRFDGLSDQGKRVSDRHRPVGELVEPCGRRFSRLSDQKKRRI